VLKDVIIGYGLHRPRSTKRRITAMEAKEKLEVAGGGASEGLAVPLFVSSYIGDHIRTLMRIKETLLATLYSVRRLRSRYVRFKSVYKRSTSIARG
jgi:hypothetical protein